MSLVRIVREVMCAYFSVFLKSEQWRCRYFSAYIVAAVMWLRWEDRTVCVTLAEGCRTNGEDFMYVILLYLR